MSPKFHLRVDGHEIEARSGQTVLEAAEAAGHWIPRLCHFEGLSPHGSCRVCTCLVDGRPQAACTFPARPGLQVEASSGRVEAIRRDVVEMLLVEGNHFCMACERSGHCELQALAYRLGIAEVRHPYQWTPREVDASHPDLWIDRNRCVQCSRCVRASQQLDSKGAYQFTERGRSQRVAVNSAEGLGGTDAELGDRASVVCPVGALLPKRVGFAVPVGERRFDRHLIGEREVEAVGGGSPAGGGR